MDIEILLACTAYITGSLYIILNNKMRKTRSYRIRKINQIRSKSGMYVQYFLKMKKEDNSQFFKYTRMNVAIFNNLLKMITPLISKRKIKDGICAQERLALTLHYLSQGSSMQTIAWKYAMGHATVHLIIIETCEAIWQVLRNNVLSPPTTEEDWLNIANGFQIHWNFPNCLGALDGKHIRIRCPRKSGSTYYNYKGYFSIVLLAASDANYIFKLIDIGGYGAQSDGGVFKNCIFGKLLEKNQMNIPSPCVLPGSNIKQPFAFVADAAFPLKSYIQRPYPGRHLSDSQRIFNYRLSRARRCIENAFGILASRWRLLQTEINADVDNVVIFIKAIICLHNYIKLSENESYCSTSFVDSEECQRSTNNLQSVGRLSANRASADIYEARDNLKNYFVSSVGSVPWQNQILTEGIYN